MSNAEINKIKLNLIAWINNLSDENLISFLEGIKNSKSNADWWNELTEGQKKIILKGLNDAEKGKLISSKDFWKKLKSA